MEVFNQRKILSFKNHRGEHDWWGFFLVLITTYGAFYHFYPDEEVFSMFLFAYLSKIIYALVLSWPSALVAFYIKKKEGVDIYD